MTTHTEDWVSSRFEDRIGFGQHFGTTVNIANGTVLGATEYIEEEEKNTVWGNVHI